MGKLKEEWCKMASMTRPRRGQLLEPGSGHKFEISHHHRQAFQLDFYFPAAIYLHTATKNFVSRIGSLAPGATLFRGATGLWRKEQEDFEEDVYVYRLIIEIGEFTPENLRPHLETNIRDLMAELGEWRESMQHQVLFTETIVCLNTADIVNPPKYRKKATEKKPKTTSRKD